MNNINLKKVNSVSGIIEVPADKSITHRAIMLSSIAEGNSVVRNYLPSEDCDRTIDAFRRMGVNIEINNGNLYIKGVGLKLQNSKNGTICNIYAGNSGTTTRLLSGILAGQNFDTIITGDASLSKRPMQRVISPLLEMGAKIKSTNGLLPLMINGKTLLKAINYQSNKSSGQVKSAVLFAGLYANGITTYTEPVKSRDHTERMLKTFGADLIIDDNSIKICPVKKLVAHDITVPGDISSAAFFIAAALIVPGSSLTIRNVGINPTRDGLIEILKQMDADITLTNTRVISQEPICDITVKYSKLKAANINSSLVPRMIDEIPIFVLIATQAYGITKVSGARELRVKESDRIVSVTSQLAKLGARIKALDDGFIVNGGGADISFVGTLLDSFKDHRIAMTLSIASLIATGETIIKDSDCVDISFPGFYKILKNICK